MGGSRVLGVAKCLVEHAEQNVWQNYYNVVGVL